ncbi:hypothetical protein P7M41_26920, partial [Vibrio parahaemolyticus]|nr:hypothetical protein [Vibrio parahaemolyticus]
QCSHNFIAKAKAKQNKNTSKHHNMPCHVSEKLPLRLSNILIMYRYHYKKLDTVLGLTIVVS